MLCPKNDGQGVYMARVLVALYDSLPPTYYDSVCGSGNQPHKAIRRKAESASNIPTAIGFNLYPNRNII